jgi:hypothetical protein
MTLILYGLYVTHSITDTRHINALHYAECHYAEWHVLPIVMLNVIMLSVVMLIVVAPWHAAVIIGSKQL